MKLRDLTPKQRDAIAKRARMNKDSLRQISSGRRTATARTAIKIERAAVKLGHDIRRETLCAGCGMCEFAKQARRKT